MSDIVTKLRSSDLGVLARREYWRLRGKREYRTISDYEFICNKYAKLGRELNLANPSRYTEKLQWLKLFYRNEYMPIVSDKYEVREYLEAGGYGYLLNDLIAVYEDVDDFDVEPLPDRFVLKAAHGSGWNLIVTDKKSVNWHIWKKIMRSWMSQNLAWFGREWNYECQKPRLIVERYLEDDSGELRDFKIICLNGKPQFMQIDENRATNHKRMYINPDGSLLKMGDSQDHNEMPRVELGKIQLEMFRLAEMLSGPFPNVRVDFYACNDRIYFGEMTFFGGSGFYSFEPDEWDFVWGEKLQLPEPNWNLELYGQLHS